MLKCLSLAILSSLLVYCLRARPGVYPRVEHLKGSSIGWAPALPTNIRLGWKRLQGTNTLAYREHSLITALKNNIILTTLVKFSLPLCNTLSA